MNLAHDAEQLMMDALDGSLSESDRDTLQAYLGTHAEERSLLERMQRMDRSLRAEPAAVVPFAMTRKVMNSVAHTHVIKPAIKGSQIAFVICASGIVVLLVALLFLVFAMQLSAPAPDATAYALLAFVLGIADVIQSIFLVVIAFIRAAFSQPLTWLISLGMALIVTGWVRVMLAVLAPGLLTAAA